MRQRFSPSQGRCALRRFPGHTRVHEGPPPIGAWRFYLCLSSWPIIRALRSTLKSTQLRLYVAIVRACEQNPSDLVYHHRACWLKEVLNARQRLCPSQDSYCLGLVSRPHQGLWQTPTQGCMEVPLSVFVAHYQGSQKHTKVYTVKAICSHCEGLWAEPFRLSLSITEPCWLKEVLNARQRLCPSQDSYCLGLVSRPHQGLWQTPTQGCMEVPLSVFMAHYLLKKKTNKETKKYK